MHGASHFNGGTLAILVDFHTQYMVNKQNYNGYVPLSLRGHVNEEGLTSNLCIYLHYSHFFIITLCRARKSTMRLKLILFAEEVHC